MSAFFSIWVFIVSLSFAIMITAVLIIARVRRRAMAISPPALPVPGDDALLSDPEFIRQRTARYGRQTHADVMGAPYGKSKFRERVRDPIRLTPRMLESMNVSRRFNGRPPLSREGIKRAMVSSPIEYRSSDSWVSYLIFYTAISSDHYSPYVTVPEGVTYTPGEPGGGLYGGAGASSGWEAPKADPDPYRAMASSLGAAAAPLGDSREAGGVVDSYQRSDAAFDTTPEPAPSAPEPAPSYSAPDPSPSYSAPDTSSFSSGSDGGGGGGGGGSD